MNQPVWYRNARLLVLVGVICAATAAMEALAMPPGNIVFEGGIRGPVIFSHSHHVRLSVDCTACHTKLFPRRHGPLPGGQKAIDRGLSCGACHNGKRAFSARNCRACHLKHLPVNADDPRYQRRGGGPIQRWDVTFEHSKHFAKGFLCSACHPKLFIMHRGATPITMAGMEQGKNCGHCHNGKTAFAPRGHCYRCHSSQLGKENIYFRGVTFRHTVHTARFGCDTCHPRPFAMRRGAAFTMADITAGRACGTCHDGRRAFAVDACQRCHMNLDNFGGTIRYPARVVGEVKFAHRVHVSRNGLQCQQCHPRPFRMAAHRNRIRMQNVLRGFDCGVCHNGRKSFHQGRLVFSAQKCSRCHSRVGPFGGYGAQGKIVWKSKRLGTITFSHKVHLKGRTCDSCHNGKWAHFKMVGATPQHMDEMLAGKSCGTCHNTHQAFGTGECQRCHVGLTPPDFILPNDDQGPVPFSHQNHLSKGVKCAECHFAIFKPKQGADQMTMDDMGVGKWCGACHNDKRAFGTDDCDRCHKSGDSGSSKPKLAPKKAPKSAPAPVPSPSASARPAAPSRPAPGK